MTSETAFSGDRTYWLDDDAVHALCSGRIDPQREAALAGDVATLVLAHRSLANHTVGNLSHIQRHLGGPTAVLEWLARFPGEPRFVARITQVGDLLDRLSDDREVVAGLRALRRRTRYPTGLAGYLVADTDESTLGSLAHVLERTAAERRVQPAGRLALATLAMLDDVLRDAVTRDPRLAAALASLPGMRRDVEEAMLGMLPPQRS